MLETLQTQVTKKFYFKGKELFIELDTHKKKSWSMTIVVDGMEHRTNSSCSK
jgi:hypothetical protein